MCFWFYSNRSVEYSGKVGFLFNVVVWLVFCFWFYSNRSVECSGRVGCWFNVVVRLVVCLM